MKEGIHPDYHEITVLMTDGTIVQDALDLRQGRRHAAPRHRPEIAPGLDRRPAAPARHRRPARPLQQALRGFRPEASTVGRTARRPAATTAGEGSWARVNDPVECLNRPSRPPRSSCAVAHWGPCDRDPALGHLAGATTHVAQWRIWSWIALTSRPCSVRRSASIAWLAWSTARPASTARLRLPALQHRVDRRRLLPPDDGGGRLLARRDRHHRAGKLAGDLGQGAERGREANGRYLHRGIARRAFERRFSLADHIKVSGASMDNGLLHVDLVREVPEEAKPRQIKIGESVKPAAGDAAKGRVTWRARLNGNAPGRPGAFFVKWPTDRPARRRNR